MPRPLNARQERFIAEYLKDQNAHAAAIRAGYSAKTKGTHAAELMRNPLVQERITLELSDMYAAMGVTALNLLRSQAAMAFFDPCKLFDAQGKPIPLHQLDQATRSVLTVSYDQRPDGSTVIRVRMPNRQQALAALEKRYAQFMEMQIDLLYSFAEEEEAGEEEGRQADAEAEADDAMPAAVSLPRTDLELMTQRAEPAPALQPEVATAQPVTVQPATAQPAMMQPGTTPSGDPGYSFRNDPYWMFGGKKHFKPEDMRNPNPMFRPGATEYKEREPESREMPGALLKGRFAGLVAPLFGR